MDETRAARPAARPAVVVLKIGLADAERFERVGLALEGARLGRNDGAGVLVGFERTLELQARLDFTDTVQFAAPAGSYDGLLLILAGVSGLLDRGVSREQIAGAAVLKVPERFTLEAGAETALSLGVSLDEIATAPPPDEREETMERWHSVDSLRSAAISLNEGSVAHGRRAWAEVGLRPETFQPGTDLTLRRGDAGALPELFRTQRPLGPVLEITASSDPDGWLGITLSYSREELARSGFAAKDIVVLQLLQDRLQYREIRPHRVDADNRTVSVRVNSLSAFFPCSPGILLDVPDLEIDAASQVISYTDAQETQISGRVVDDRATASILTQASRTSWISQGWFVFEGVPLQPSDTGVVLGAQVEGLFEHFCEFTVRRALPVKTITRPNTPFAGTAAFGDEGTAFVATVLRQTVNVDAVEGIDSLRGFLAGVERNIPLMFWFDADADQWQSFRLLSDRFYENEFARLAIDQIAENLLREVPINESYPEAVRHLRSLADFVAAFPESNASFGLALIITIVAQLLGANNLSASPSLPLVTLDEGHVGCAFVAASYSGWRASIRTSVDSFLRPRHVPRQADRRAQFGLRLLGGRLFFVRASRGGVAATEVVADDVLCGALSIKRNPETGQPAILAIGLPAEDAVPFDESTLLLFQRQEDGQWAREVVLEGQAIIDAYMDFGFGSRPFVIAAVENPNVELNADMLFLTPLAGAGAWDVQPLTWNLSGFPANTSLGMWPRIVVADWPPEEPRTLYCAFAFFTQEMVFWLAGTRSGGAWQVMEAGQGTRASLSGAANIVAPPGFTEDVVGFSRVSFYHWAPSIAPAGDGSVWYAFGNGVLHLARFDGARIEDRIVDVDRTTGFLPHLATRAAGSLASLPGTPAITYKDAHGASTFNFASGIEFATGLDLHFFDLGSSHQVPRLDPPAPLAPRHSVQTAFLGDFGTRIPFTCGRFTEYVGIALLSALSEALGGEEILTAAEQRRVLDETQASLYLNSTIDIHARPQDGLLEITIRNDRPNEPGAIVSMLLRQRTGRPARLIVTDSAGNEGEGACGLSQDSWDAIANDFVNVPVDPGSLLPSDEEVEVQDVRLEGLTLSFAAAPRPSPRQQGAIRFRIDLPSIRVEGESRGVGFTATATEPSVFEFDVAPFIADGGVRWHVRSVSGRVGHIDVDVELDFLTWIGVVGGLLTGTPSVLFIALVLVDPIAGSFATDETNNRIAERRGLPLGGLPDQLTNLLATHALRKGFGTSTDLSRLAFEAVLLEDLVLTFFLRPARVAGDAPPATVFSFFPNRVRNFGNAVVGEASGIRPVLLVNDGHFPVSLDNVQVVSSSEFVLAGPPVWPKIILPGHSETLELEFRPQNPPGFRQVTLRADFNRGRQLLLALLGTAEAAPVPVIRVIPRQLTFGVVNVGSTSTLQLTVANDGAVPLTISALRLEGLGSTLFALPGQTPSAVQPGQSTSVNVSFTPAAMVSGGHHATLVIESNADNDPQLAVSLFGQGAASSILVMPTQIAFNPSPLAPALPPGLGSSRGRTIYNVGVAALTIAGSSFRVLDAASGQLSPDYQLLDSAGQPFPQNDLQLNSGQFQALSVLFRPLTAGDHPARIEVSSTDQAQPSVTVSITGQGI